MYLLETHMARARGEDRATSFKSGAEGEGWMALEEMPDWFVRSIQETLVCEEGIVGIVGICFFLTTLTDDHVRPRDPFVAEERTRGARGLIKASATEDAPCISPYPLPSSPPLLPPPCPFRQRRGQCI